MKQEYGLKAKKASNNIKVITQMSRGAQKRKEKQQLMKIGRDRSKRAKVKVNIVNLKKYITLLFKLNKRLH